MDARKLPKQQGFTANWKRVVTIGVCFVLIVVRWVWPNLRVDSTTLWLVAIAAVLFLLPDLKALVPYIKRIKFGDTELELKEKIGRLDPEVQKARDAASVQGDSELTEEALERVSNEIDKILEQSAQAPRAALLLLSSKIEQELRKRLENAGTGVRNYSAIRSVETGVRERVFPEEFLSAFRDFWAVRNQVAHGAAFDVPDSYILSLVSLGTELLKALTSSVRKDGGA